MKFLSRWSCVEGVRDDVFHNPNERHKRAAHRASTCADWMVGAAVCA